MYSMVSESRDRPQPLLYHRNKTPNCTFKSFEKGATKCHEISCTERGVEKLLAGIDSIEEFDFDITGRIRHNICRPLKSINSWRMLLLMLICSPASQN